MSIEKSLQEGKRTPKVFIEEIKAQESSVEHQVVNLAHERLT